MKIIKNYDNFLNEGLFNSNKYNEGDIIANKIIDKLMKDDNGKFHEKIIKDNKSDSWNMFDIKTKKHKIYFEDSRGGGESSTMFPNYTIEIDDKEEYKVSFKVGRKLQKMLIDICKYGKKFNLDSVIKDLD